MTLLRALLGLTLGCTLLASAALGPASAANPPDQKTLDILQRIKQAEAALHTFSARFDQLQKSGMLSEVVRSEGIIRYAAGGKLLFEVTRPDPLKVLFDDEWVSILDPASGKVKTHRVGRQENILNKYFGVGQSLSELVERFDIKAVSNAPLPGVTLTLKPRTGGLARKVALISAEVDDATWLPRQIFIQQARGDWMRLELDFTAVNEPLPADSFVLQPDPPAANSVQTPTLKP